MATGLSASYSLSGPSSTRRLGTEAGALRRASRSLRRQGFRNEAGKMAAAAEVSKIKNGGGIGSADEDIAVNEYNLRSMRGLASQQARSFDSPVPATGGAAEPAPVAPAATGQTVRYVNGLPEVVPASGTQTATSGAQTPGGGTQAAGGGVMVARNETKPYDFSQSPNRLNLDMSERGPFKGGLSEQQDRTPGNRASAERESVLAQIRRESAGSSESRSSILSRINRERKEAGKAPLFTKQGFDDKNNVVDNIDTEAFRSALASVDTAEADKRYAEAGRKAREAFDTAEAAKPKTIGYSKAQQYKDEVMAAAPSGKPLEEPAWAKTRPATPEDSAASRLLGGVAERPKMTAQGNPLNYSRGGALTAAGTGMSIAGAGATSFTAPSVFSETLRKERAKGYKAPLYSAAIAAKRGAGALLSDIKRGYK